MSTPSYRETKICFAGETERDGRRVTLWRVVHKADGSTLFGPADWKACCAYKRGLVR